MESCHICMEDSDFYYKYARPSQNLLEIETYDECEWVMMIQNVEIIDEIATAFFQSSYGVEYLESFSRLLYDPNLSDRICHTDYPFRGKMYKAKMTSSIDPNTKLRILDIWVENDHFLYKSRKIKHKDIAKLELDLKRINLRGDSLGDIPFLKNMAMELGCRIKVTYSPNKRLIHAKFIEHKTEETVLYLNFQPGSPIFVERDSMYCQI